MRHILSRLPTPWKMKLPVHSVRSAGANALPSSKRMFRNPLTFPAKNGSSELMRIPGSAVVVEPVSSNAVSAVIGSPMNSDARNR